jgi:predicted dehydrogenase
LDDPYNGDIVKYPEADRIVTFNYTYNGYKDDNNVYDQHIAFVKAVMAGKPANISLETGLYDLKIVKAVYLASKLKRWVDVNEVE